MFLPLMQGWRGRAARHSGPRASAPLGNPTLGAHACPRCLSRFSDLYEAWKQEAQFCEGWGPRAFAVSVQYHRPVPAIVRGYDAAQRCSHTQLVVGVSALCLLHAHTHWSPRLAQRSYKAVRAGLPGSQGGLAVDATSIQ